MNIVVAVLTLYNEAIQNTTTGIIITDFNGLNMHQFVKKLSRDYRNFFY